MRRAGSVFRRQPASAGRRLAFLVPVAAVIALPAAAYGLIGEGALQQSGLLSAANHAPFTPASADPRVARIVAERSAGATPFLRFTPAGTADVGSRNVTVAVRVDQQAARAISARGAGDPVTELRTASREEPRIAPTRYNLGLARGYQSFARAVPPAAAARVAPLDTGRTVDLAEFEPSRGVKEQPSRFAARVQLEEGATGLAGPPSQLVKRRQPVIDQTLDVAGSYRLTRNLDVTAGLRYSQERDLAPLPDIEEQDSQAIYIGTQFRF